jgi:hypothetical protein
MNPAGIRVRHRLPRLTCIGRETWLDAKEKSVSGRAWIRGRGPIVVGDDSIC